MEDREDESFWYSMRCLKKHKYYTDVLFTYFKFHHHYILYYPPNTVNRTSAQTGTLSTKSTCSLGRKELFHQMHSTPRHVNYQYLSLVHKYFQKKNSSKRDLKPVQKYKRSTYNNSKLMPAPSSRLLNKAAINNMNLFAIGDFSRIGYRRVRISQ